MTEATEDDIAAVIVAAQTSNSNICAAALQQKFVITRRDKAAAPSKLTEDQIMQVIRKVTSGELREMLTCKRWKDGIDIDLPTFAAERLAEEFRAVSPVPSSDRGSQ